MAPRCHTGFCPMFTVFGTERCLRVPGRPGAESEFRETGREAEVGWLRDGAAQHLGVALDFVPCPVSKDGRVPSGTWKTGGRDEFRETGAEGRTEVLGRLDLLEGPYPSKRGPSGHQGEGGRVEERSSGVQPGRVGRPVPSGADRNAWHGSLRKAFGSYSTSWGEGERGDPSGSYLLNGTGVSGGTS